MPGSARELRSLRGVLGERLRGRSANWSWAFVTQAISSLTSLGLSVLAGRTLGASGLGVVFAGWAGYLVLLAIHRALVVNPLIASSSMLSGPDRRTATRAAAAASLTIGVVAACALAILGAVAGGTMGRAWLVFAPWLVPAFAHELLRSALFRDGRGRQATLAQATWLVTLLVLAPVAAGVDSVWVVVGAWGIGAAIAALTAAASVGVSPARLSVMRTWFFEVAFPFGRWLALQEGVLALSLFGLVLILTRILGTAGVGGMRAADSIYAPFTLLGPALLLAALPPVSRAHARSQRDAVRLAIGISGGSVFLTVIYAAVMLVAGSSLLIAFYGGSFEPYADLVVPMCAWQLALAAGYGFGILLLAEKRGKQLFVTGALVSVTLLVASPALAEVYGVRGAVWGFAIAATVGGALAACLSIPASRSESAADRNSLLARSQAEP
jgi:O-antigen/teichoic acid export membrane protein